MAVSSKSEEVLPHLNKAAQATNYPRKSYIKCVENVFLAPQLPLSTAGELEQTMLAYCTALRRNTFREESEESYQRSLFTPLSILLGGLRYLICNVHIRSSYQSQLYIHSPTCVKSFDHKCNLIKEPRLRGLVRNKGELVILLAKLMCKTDARVLDCHTLYLIERQLPLKPQLLGPEGQNPRSRQKYHVVPARRICHASSAF